MRILLVDDDLPTLKAVSALLGAEGHAIDTARDGASAIERLRESSYDVLITDLVMPGMRGDELTRRARALDAALRCVIISGQPRPRDAVPEAAVWLTKPLDVDLLLATLLAG